MNPSQLVTLRNGAQAPLSAVTVIFMALKRLMDENPIALFELRELCRNHEHRLFGTTGETLEALALSQDGQPNSCVRDVVLSGIEGELLGMTLVSPLGGETTALPASDA